MQVTISPHLTFFAPCSPTQRAPHRRPTCSTSEEDKHIRNHRWLRAYYASAPFCVEVFFISFFFCFVILCSRMQTHRYYTLIGEESVRCSFRVFRLVCQANAFHGWQGNAGRRMYDWFERVGRTLKTCWGANGCIWRVGRGDREVKPPVKNISFDRTYQLNSAEEVQDSAKKGENVVHAHYALKSRRKKPQQKLTHAQWRIVSDEGVRQMHNLCIFDCIWKRKSIHQPSTNTHTNVYRVVPLVFGTLARFFCSVVGEWGMMACEEGLYSNQISGTIISNSICCCCCCGWRSVLDAKATLKVVRKMVSVS